MQSTISVTQLFSTLGYGSRKDGDLTFIALGLLRELGQVDIVLDRHSGELVFYTTSQRVNNLSLLKGMRTAPR